MLYDLFTPSGSKIRKFAKILFIINIVISAILLLILPITILDVMHEGGMFGGGIHLLDILLAFLLFIIFLTLYILCSYVMSLIIYGFGTLIDNSSKIRLYIKDPSKEYSYKDLYDAGLISKKAYELAINTSSDNESEVNNDHI